MIKQFELSKFRVGEEEYAEGTIEINEEKQEVKIQYTSKTLRGDQSITLKRITFDKPVTVADTAAGIEVDNAYLQLKNKNQRSELLRGIKALQKGDDTNQETMPQASRNIALKRSYPVKDIKYNGVTYPEGTLKIDGSNTSIELEQIKRSFFGDKKTTITSFKYSIHTRISSSGTRIEVDEVELTLETLLAVQELRQSLEVPSKNAKKRVEEAKSIAESYARDYLGEYASLLDEYTRYTNNPRESTTIGDFKSSTEDFFSYTEKRYHEKFGEALKKAQSRIEEQRSVLPKEDFQRVHAVMYAYGGILKSLAIGDEQSLKTHAALAEALTSTKVDVASIQGVRAAEAIDRILPREASKSPTPDMVKPGDRPKQAYLKMPTL